MLEHNCEVSWVNIWKKSIEPNSNLFIHQTVKIHDLLRSLFLICWIIKHFLYKSQIIHNYTTPSPISLARDKQFTKPKQQPWTKCFRWWKQCIYTCSMAVKNKLKLVKYELWMAVIADNAFFLYKKCLCHLKSQENSPSYIWVRHKKSFSSMVKWVLGNTYTMGWSSPSCFFFF